MALTLQDAEVQDTLDLFLTQARVCAETPHAGRGCILGRRSILGIAAMSTVFPCLLTVGEALARSEAPTKRGTAYGSNEWPTNAVIIAAFYARMKDGSWFIPPDDAVHNDDDACEMLGKIRHGLAHAISMPEEVSFVRRRRAARKAPTANWKIVVPAFVQAVEETIAEIRREQPGLDLSEVIKDRKLVHAHPLGPRSRFMAMTESATSSGH